MMTQAELTTPYAWVRDGVVIDRRDLSPVNALDGVACPADVEIGWLYDGQNFVSPPPPPPPVGLYLVLANGVVVNHVLGDAVMAAEFGWLPCPAGVGIGWLYDGQNFVSPPPQPKPVPAQVSRTQLRLALLAYSPDLLASIDTAVAGSGDPVLTERWGAPTMERASPLLGAMAAQFGLSDAAVDDIFRAAAGQ